jgi:hypothetical protein
LKLVENILTVETRLFFVLVEIFKIQTFELRLGQVKIFIKIVEIYIETVKIFKICRDFSRFISLRTSGSKILTN